MNIKTEKPDFSEKKKTNKQKTEKKTTKNSSKKLILNETELSLKSRMVSS